MDTIARRYLQKAHKCVEEGRLEEALHYGEKSILQCGRQIVPLEALNLRAAILVKLHKFTEAGVDAKSMIKQFPADPRGYLRLAQIYRYQARQNDAIDNIQKAVRVLKSGLDRVDKSNREFLPQVKSMKRLHDELKEALEPATLPDLACRLPLELFQQVLCHSHKRDVLRWRRVSRCWKAAIHSAPIWQSLQINRSFMPRTSWQINFLVSLARSSANSHGLLHFEMDSTLPHKAAGSRPRPNCEDLALAVLQKCDGLLTLSLDFEPSRSWQHILKSMQHQHLTKVEILPRFSRLWSHERPTFASLHETRRALIELSAPICDERDICELLGRLPSLERAVFCGFTPSNRGISWQWPLTNFSLRSLILLPHPARHAGYDSICTKALNLRQLSHFAPSMESIELGSCTFPYSEYSEPADFTSFPKLKSLRLDWHPSCREMPCLMFPQIPSTLQELMLECPDNLPVFGNEAEPCNAEVLQHMKRLRLSARFALDVDRLRRISGPCLEELTFIDRGCPSQWIAPADDLRSEGWIIKAFEALSGSSQTLSLRRVRMLSPFVACTPDALAAAMSGSCDSLEEVSVLGDCGFTGLGIATLCHKTGVKLKAIEVGRCPKAKADTAQYVRSQGVSFSGRVGPL